MKRSYRLFTLSVIAVFMATLMCFNYTASNYVIAQNEIIYISEVKIFEGDNEAAARNQCESQGYTFIPNDVNSGTTKKPVYLGYKTTRNVKEAIYELRLLAMDRGYQIKDKAALQEEHQKQNSEAAEALAAATNEFVENFQAGSPKALDAYDGMNLIIVPEAGDQKFGDFLLAGKGTKSFYANFITNTSSATLNSVINYLSTGLAPYNNDVDEDTGEDKTTTWAEQVASSALWDIIENELDEDTEDELYKNYGDAALALHKQFQDFASNVDNALASYKGEAIVTTESVDTFIEKTETLDENNNSVLFINAYNTLNEYDATEDMPLGDYILELGYQTEDEVDLKQIFPIVDSMSYAQCKLTELAGLLGAVSNLGKNERSEEFNQLLEQTKAKLKKLINSDFYSIWMNADPDFENSKVAYTSDAIRVNSAQAQLARDTSNDAFDKIEKIMKWCGIVSSALTVVTFIIGKYAVVGLLTLIAKVAAEAAAATIATVIGTLTTISTFLGYFGLGFGLLILVFTLFYYLIKYIINQIKKSLPKEYTDMPDYVVDAAETKEGTANVKYKAVKNGGGGIGDLNHHEGQQGWVCMYYTTDSRVGSPIRADEDGKIFDIVYGDSVKHNGYASANFFGEISPGNCNTFAKADDVGGIYIHYHTEKSLANKSKGAAADNSSSGTEGKQYIKDLIVRTGKTEERAKAQVTVKGYYLFDRNLTPSPYAGKEPVDDEDETYYTYIGYKLTTDPKEAIRDIRVATFLPNSTVNFGDVSYGCAGTIGFHANSAEEDEKFPQDLTGLYVTASEKAGTPIAVDALHVVTDYSQASPGWEPVTTFSGAPYDFNSVYINDSATTIDIIAGAYNHNLKMIGYRTDSDNNWKHTKTLLYYEPEVTYTSGTQYLSGIFYFGGYSTHKVNNRGVSSDIDQLRSAVTDFPNTVVASYNLAISLFHDGNDRHSIQKYQYLCYTWSYNPNRALYDAAVYQSSIYTDTLPYTISKAESYGDKKASGAEKSVNYVAASVLAAQSSDTDYVAWGYLYQNAYMNQYNLQGQDPYVVKGYTKEFPENITTEVESMAILPTGLYVAGYTEGKNPLTLDDVILTTSSATGNNDNGNITFNVEGKTTLGGSPAIGEFASVQELKNPHSTKAYNLALPGWYDKKDNYYGGTSFYMYLRKTVTKGKYISRVFVGEYCKDDYTPENKDDPDDEYENLSKSTDHQAMMTATASANGEVIMYNMSITKEYQWFNYKDGKKTSLDPANDYTYASYISVARTDKEQDAIRGLLLFRSDEKAVPEQIQIQGMAYYCASATTPLYIVKNDEEGNDPEDNEMEYVKYYLYYTFNKGAIPGKPITAITVNNEPFVTAQATVLCADKEDVVAYENGKKVIKESAEIKGNTNLNCFIHAAYEHGVNTYYNKLFIGEGNSRKEALFDLLEQGCTEFCDMDFNVDSGGKYVYFGYRGYTIDDDKIKMLSTETARDAEIKSQQQSAVYDIVITVGEDYHAEGIMSERYQIYYAPVSNVDLNAGTQGPKIYMYYTSVLVAKNYNNKVKGDDTKLKSSDPSGVFTAPVTKFAFARYDRVPYTDNGTAAGDETKIGDGENNIFRWEYVTEIDFRTIADLNAGVVKFNGDHEPKDNRISVFIQRGDGSVKPWGQITGGFVSACMTVGEVYRVR